MSSSSNSSISTPSSSASSARVYDFATMMKLATSSISAMSSTTALARLHLDEDVAEIVKNSSSTSTSPSDQSEGYDGEYDEDEDEDDASERKDWTYGSGFDIRTDLSEEVIEELKQAVYDAISSEVPPLSPETESVPLPSFAQPQPSSQNKPRTAAIIVQNPSSQFQLQSRAFSTLSARRQPARQPLTYGREGFNGSNTNTLNASNASNWRRDASKIYGPIRSTMNVNAVSSWRRVQPGTEWKWNEHTNGYNLIKV